MNKTLEKKAREILKDLLDECEPTQQNMFKRMYFKNKLDLTTSELSQGIDVEKIDFAITQCERTIEKNKTK